MVTNEIVIMAKQAHLRALDFERRHGSLRIDPCEILDEIIRLENEILDLKEENNEA